MSTSRPIVRPITRPPRSLAASLLAATAAASVAALLVLANPLAASAHDEVSTTTPAAGEHLDVAPQEVSLHFSEDLLPEGAKIIVTDDSEADWAFGDPQVVGPDVTQTLQPDLPDGRYRVSWRVVSADGHPVSDSFSFTVGTVSASEPTAATPTPGADASTGTTAAENTTSGRTDEPPYALIAIGGAILGIIVFAIIVITRSRRKTS